MIRVNHFPQADELRATVWKQLPSMCEKLGKSRFKSLYLELFLSELVRNLEREASGGVSQLSVAGAAHCCDALSTLLGKGIFRGRVEESCGEEAARLVDRHLNMIAEARRGAERLPTPGVMRAAAGAMPTEQIKGLALEQTL